MSKNRLLVIVTLNYNQSKMTLECVDSILESDYNNYKLVIVDNGSKEDEYQYLMDKVSSEVIVERVKENCGYVGGVNKGLSVASRLNPDYYVVMNNDTIIDSKALTYLVESSIRNKDNAIITGKVYDFQEKERLQDIGGVMKIEKYLIVSYPGKNEIDNGQYNIEERRDIIDDIFWLIPKKIFQDIGYYSKHFFIYSEQGDYARRAIKSGYKLIYTPKPKLWHKGSATTGDGNRRAPHVNYWRGKGGIVYRAKHIDKKVDFWVYSTKTFTRLLLKSVAFKFLGKKDLSRTNFAACRGVLDGMLWNLNRVDDNGYNPYLK